MFASAARAKSDPVFTHDRPQSQPLASDGLKSACPMPGRELAGVEKSLSPSSMRTDATANSTGLRTQARIASSAQNSSRRRIARTTSRIE